MADEEWRPIKGYPDYAVSDLGNVMRTTKSRRGPGRPGTILKTHARGKYPAVNLYRDGVMIPTNVHIIVCETFHGPRPSRFHEVAHWDGINTNVRSSNLRWATHRENSDDAIRHGSNRGTRNGHSRLTEDDVRNIRRRRALGEVQQRIADDYGICQVQVSTICSFKQWAWVV